MAEGIEDSSILKAAGPSQFAHCDNSKEGSLAVLKENLPAPEYERRQKSHWAIMNVGCQAHRVTDTETDGIKGMATD